MKIIYQISMVSGAASTAWIDVTREQYEDAGLYPEYARRALVTADFAGNLLLALEAVYEAMETDNDYDLKIILPDMIKSVIDKAKGE